MTSLYPNEWREYLRIALIFLRVMGLFLLVPGFSHKAIPMQVKIFLAMALSLAFFPLLKNLLPGLPETLGGITLLALKETFVGLLMGTGAYLTFEAIHLAAHFVGNQLGFGTVNLFDPHSQQQSSMLVPFYGWIALVLFFLFNLHHQSIYLLVHSFETTARSPVELGVSTNLYKWMMILTGRLFSIAIQMAAPITLLMLATQVSLGVLARTIPQMNIFLFSFPITMLVGFVALYLMAPDLLEYMHQLLEQIGGDIVNLLRVI